MKKLIPIVFIGLFSYLWCMNSTENRQSLTDDHANAAYVSFRKSYLEKTGDSRDHMILRCYEVYQGLLHMKPAYGSNDSYVKSNLIKMGYCELDQDVLVLKGFHIEDTVGVLAARIYQVEKK